MHGPLNVKKKKLNLYCEGEIYRKNGILRNHIKLILNVYLSIFIYIYYHGSCDGNFHRWFGEGFGKDDIIK